MTTDNSLVNYDEDIVSFVFRKSASLRIPKEWRERAFIQQIDVKITSVAYEPYLSYRSNPANSSYGKAVIVMRDYCTQEIELSQPRQTIYYGVVHEAFAHYYALYLNYKTNEVLKAIAENLLVPIGQELGLSVGSISPSCPAQPAWIELPPRELYIETREGTQFEIEFSRWTLTTPLLLGECEYDGKSGQVDGDKDAGLPIGGVQPNRATDPSKPFDGLKPATAPTEFGNWLNIKGDTLNGVDPDNLPEFLDANGNPLNFEGGQCTGNPNRGYWVAITRFYNDALQQEFVNSNPNPFGNAVAIAAGLQVIAIDAILIGSFGKWRIFLSNGTITTLDAFGGSNTFQFVPTDYEVKVSLYDYSTNSVVPDTCGNYRPFE